MSDSEEQVQPQSFNFLPQKIALALVMLAGPNMTSPDALLPLFFSFLGNKALHQLNWSASCDYLWSEFLGRLFNDRKEGVASPSYAPDRAIFRWKVERN
jgi:hypothetical protein